MTDHVPFSLRTEAWPGWAKAPPPPAPPGTPLPLSHATPGAGAPLSRPTGPRTVCHLLLTVHEVPADPGGILFGAQGSLDALDEVAEVV